MCELVKWANGYPKEVLNVINSESEDILENPDDFISDRKMNYFTGKRRRTVALNEDLQNLVINYLLEKGITIQSHDDIPTTGTKYFAATRYCDMYKRTLQYRCEEGEEMLKSRSVSSVVCLRKEETLVGRIQHFLSVCNEELVLVKWYGEVERDPQTRLWLCTGEEGTFISYVPITLLSRPLVHAWEDNIIWLLNYHDELL